MRNFISGVFQTLADYTRSGGSVTGTDSGVVAPSIAVDIDPLLTRYDFTVKSNVLEDLGIYPSFNNKGVTTDFELYTPDATGEDDWYEYQEVWLGTYIRYGECFEEIIDDQFRMWPPKSLAEQGIRYDSDNRPIEYLFNVTRNGSVVDTKKIPAANMIHTYNKKEAGQLRGKSYFGAAKIMLESLYNSNFYQGKMIEMAALNPVILKLGKEGLAQLATEWEGGERPTDDQLADRFAQRVKTKPGATTVTTNTIESIPIDRSKGYPTDITEHWSYQTLLLISAGLGLSLPTVTGDYRHLLAVAVRAIRDNDIKYYKRLQRKLLKASKRWYMAWLMSNNPNRQGTIISSFTGWSKPGFPALEPEKDARALDLELRNKTESRTHVIRTRGRSPEEVAEEIKNDERLGLVPSSSSNSQDSGSSGSDDDKEEDPDDPEEDKE